jgi:hypothetical protein
LGSKEGSILANVRDAFKEQRLGDNHWRGGKANASNKEERATLMSAEDRLPESAESVAAEVYRH